MSNVLCTVSAEVVLRRYSVKVQGIIRSTVAKFVRRTGWDFGEMLGEANLLFLKACHTHDPSQGKFGKRVREIVWFGLLDLYRAARLREARLSRNNLRKDMPDRHRTFDRHNFFACLSHDAVKVALLALSPPRCLRDVEDKPHKQRMSIRSFLKKIGWTARRIQQSFGEIAEVLQQ